MSELVCSGLTKSYGGVLALADFSHSFGSGHIAAIVGPNGAGKTTLFDLVTGLQGADRGTSNWAGLELSGLSPGEVAQAGIVRTFQQVRLSWSVTALENVMLSLPSQDGEYFIRALMWPEAAIGEDGALRTARLVLQRVGLDEAADVLAGNLSYGQQKLLSLACAAGSSAPVLLLDEPVAGVHRDVCDRIVHVLREEAELGKCIVMIEHTLQVVRRLATEVIVLDSGKLLAAGRPSKVLKMREVLHAYLG